MEKLILSILSLPQSFFSFVFGNSEKLFSHENKLRKFELDREELEKENERKLDLLDDDMGTLYDSRRARGMTKSEVFIEHDRKRSVLIEECGIKFSRIGSDIDYHKKMISRNEGLIRKVKARVKSYSDSKLFIYK